jgi:hypothetical protein
MLTLSFNTLEEAEAATGMINKWKLRSKDGLNFSAHYQLKAAELLLATEVSVSLVNSNKDYWNYVAYKLHKDFKPLGAVSIFCTYCAYETHPKVAQFN